MRRDKYVSFFFSNFHFSRGFIELQNLSVEEHIHGRRHPGDDNRRDIGHHVQTSTIDDHRVRPERCRESMDRLRGVRIQGQRHYENTILVYRASDLGAPLRPRRLQLHPDDK